MSKADIGLLEHVQCTCMSDSPKMSIPKFKYKLQTCKIKSSKLSSLIDSFRPFINQTCSMKLLVKSNRDAQKRIFTNFTNFKIWVKFVNFYENARPGILNLWSYRIVSYRTALPVSWCLFFSFNFTFWRPMHFSAKCRLLPD